MILNTPASPPPPHKYLFTYLYINTNTDHVVFLFPFILYFIICYSCFHRSNHVLLFCGGAGETFGWSLSMFALSSPHDLDEMTFLFRQIWENTNRGHRSDSPPRLQSSTFTSAWGSQLPTLHKAHDCSTKASMKIGFSPHHPLQPPSTQRLRRSTKACL